MRWPLLEEGLDDAGYLRAIRPRLLVVRRRNEVFPFSSEVACSLRIGVGQPEVVISGVDVSQIGHLLEVTAKTAH